jgi:hypothetical protein
MRTLEIECNVIRTGIGMIERIVMVDKKIFSTADNADRRDDEE